MSRTSTCKNQLLLITGRLQGVPKISFDQQPIGKTPGHMERADVSGPMTPNAVNAVMRMKLVREPAFEVVRLSDIDRRE
jgi:hypothetical protein